MMIVSIMQSQKVNPETEAQESAIVVRILGENGGMRLLRQRMNSREILNE